MADQMNYTEQEKEKLLWQVLNPDSLPADILNPGNEIVNEKMAKLNIVAECQESTLKGIWFKNISSSHGIRVERENRKIDGISINLAIQAEGMKVQKVEEENKKKILGLF